MCCCKSAKKRKFLFRSLIRPNQPAGTRKAQWAIHVQKLIKDSFLLQEVSRQNAWKNCKEQDFDYEVSVSEARAEAGNHFCGKIAIAFCVCSITLCIHVLRLLSCTGVLNVSNIWLLNPVEFQQFVGTVKDWPCCQFIIGPTEVMGLNKIEKLYIIDSEKVCHWDRAEYKIYW